jgi:hypothetical protein
MTRKCKRVNETDVKISRKSRSFEQFESKRELLKTLFIPGITESVFAFLMGPIDSTRYYCNANLRLFFQMREICKSCKLLSLRLHPWICPEISKTGWSINNTPEKLREKLNAWTKLLPKLQSIRTAHAVVHPTITTIYLLCRGKLLYKKIFEKWDCIRLQRLDLTGGGWVETDQLIFLENKFPNLTHLAIGVILHDHNTTMKDMNNLLELKVTTRGFLSCLHVSNMKSLRNLCIETSLPELEFASLPELEDVRVNADKLIFHNNVPLQKLRVHKMDHEENGMIDPYDKVCWENLQYLDFEHFDDWQRICPRLESLHTLICWQDKTVPNINFSKLQQLSHLEWDNLNFDLFKLFNTFDILTTLKLHWKFDYVFDFSSLSKFQNLRKVTISETVGKSVNIASLLALPKLEYLDTCFNNLSESDDKLLTTWKCNNPFKHPYNSE